MSIDAEVKLSNQPYLFANDNPLNSEDALGNLAYCPGSWNNGICTGEAAPKKESKSQTLSLIEKSLQGLGLTGAEVTAIAKEISTNMAENGGKIITNRTANALEAAAGVGRDLSDYAGVGGAIVTLSSDLANGDKLNYSLVDTGLQAGAGWAGGEIGAEACAPLGLGDAVCAGAGFLIGFLAAWGTGAAFQYKYGKYV
jgi:hypothetical protein